VIQRLQAPASIAAKVTTLRAVLPPASSLSSELALEGGWSESKEQVYDHESWRICKKNLIRP